MIFAKDFVQDVTDTDPVNGMKFYRRLSRMLGNRLIFSYQLQTDGTSQELPYGAVASENIESHQNP